MRQSRAEFPNDPRSVAQARDFVASALASVDAPLQPVAALLTSELATNAVRHTDAGYAVAVECDETEVRIGVADRSGEKPTVCWVDREAFAGRGLKIVEALADRWWVDPDPAGKLVWVALSRARRTVGGGERTTLGAFGVTEGT